MLNIQNVAQKVLLTHQLPIQKELTDIINDYSYYDASAFTTRKHFREQVMPFIRQMMTHTMIVDNHLDSEFPYEMWRKDFPGITIHHKMHVEKAIIGTHCTKCGNYESKPYRTQHPLTICKCHYHVEEMEEQIEVESVESVEYDWEREAEWDAMIDEELMLEDRDEDFYGF